MRQAAKLLALFAATVGVVPAMQRSGLGHAPSKINISSPSLSTQSEIYISQGEFEQWHRAGHLLYQGLREYNSRNFSEALNLWQEALSIAQQIDDHRTSARLLNSIGNAYSELGDNALALESYQEALALARTVSDYLEEASILNNMGVSYINYGEYQLALEAFQESLEIKKEFFFYYRLSQADSLLNICIVYRELGDYEIALETCQTALLMYQEDSVRRTSIIDSLEGEASTLHTLSSIHTFLGQYFLALRMTEESLKISEEIGNSKGIASALSQLGNIEGDLGLDENSIEFYQRSSEIYRQIGDLTGEANSLNNIGIAYKNLGRYEMAIEAYERSLEIYRRLDNVPGIAASLCNLGVVYQASDQSKVAIELYQEAIQLLEDNQIDAPQSIAKYLGNLGTAYTNLGEHSRALEYYQQALELQRQIGNSKEEVLSLSNIGYLSALAGNFDVAEEYLSDAIKIQESLRSFELNDSQIVSFVDTQQFAFRLQQQVLVAQHKYEAALAVAEQGRAWVFVNLLSQQVSNQGASVTSGSPSIEGIQAFAQRQQTTLVEYSITRFEELGAFLYIWVVSPDGAITFRQQSLTDIDLIALVTNTRDAIEVRGIDRATAIPTVDPNQSAQDLAQRRAKTDENLRQLHQILIEPIADLLPTDPDQKVAFIPQGELFLVPFPALKDANGQYLIENHTILTAPSIQVLQLTQDLAAQSPSPRRLSGVEAANPLIVGDPTMPTVTFFSPESGTFDDIRLAPLAGAYREAVAVADTLQSKALTYDDATEARVKQLIADADLIHLATHGLLEYGDPRQTGSRDTPGAIALAPGNGEDGLLTSTEILQMELQADLVVLSACDTGRGRITGDGVIGLSRSFIAAGVPSVIVSLWAVPDAPTAELMTEFYDQLAQGQTKTQALRQAMLITMQTRPDPKDWAAFTLIGNAE
jgi:CHAT domain-containing protein/Tfp pilus assembly protein PilF